MTERGKVEIQPTFGTTAPVSSPLLPEQKPLWQFWRRNRQKPETPESALSVLRMIDNVVMNELVLRRDARKLGRPDKELLNSCSTVYNSVVSLLGLYRGTRVSFSLTLAEFTIIVIWFAGATVAAWLGISFWSLRGSDIANLVLYWTAVLLGLMGISALSSLRK
jgi:hypothetical protein